MSMQGRVDALKQQFEQLFPGKWLTGNKRQRNLSTGIDAVDNGVTKGVARRRISEWCGPLSSGKTTLLRSAITHWCEQGLNVAYIDSEGKLYPADWSSVEKPGKGKFWIVRPEDQEKSQNNSANKDEVVPLISKRNILMQEALWSADQFVRSGAFDVVILDLGSSQLAKRKGLGMGYSAVPSRVYARLQRALEKSKAALIIVSDTVQANASIVESKRTKSESKNEIFPASLSNNWGCHARFVFNRGVAVRSEAGLNGVAMITPTIRLTAWRDGLAQEVEVSLGTTVPNRLFTHTQVPDRRTSKG